MYQDGVYVGVNFYTLLFIFVFFVFSETYCSFFFSHNVFSPSYSLEFTLLHTLRQCEVSLVTVS